LLVAKKWEEALLANKCKYADFEAANFMICDLDLEEVFVHNDIQQSWSNLKTAFLNIMES